MGYLDGDGTPDLGAGIARADDGGLQDSGAVLVLFLLPDGTVRAEQKISALEGGFVGPHTGWDELGSSIDTCGDLDGDGERSSRREPVHTYSQPGTYSVSLTVSSHTGGAHRSIGVDLIQVAGPSGERRRAPPTADFQFAPRSGVAPLRVMFQDRSFGTITSRSWS